LRTFSRLIGCNLGLLVLWTAALCQQTPQRVLQRMSESLATQDYICSSTLERSVTGKPQTTLRAEVGVINGKELYAWPTTDADVALLKDALADYTQAGTGTFAMYTRQVFRTNVATLYSASDETEGGRKTNRWEFGVPKEASKLVFNVNGKDIVAGYSGMIWADPDKLDVVRLDVQPTDLPPDVKTLTQTIRYARGSIQGVSTNLPASSEVVMQDTRGTETRLAATITNCHLFIANKGTQFIDSKVTDSAPPPSTTVLGASLPPKTMLELSLDEAVDEREATPGTKLTWKVSRDVKSGGQVLIRKGAPAKGHITRVSRQTYRAMDAYRTYFIIGVQLDTVETPEQNYRVIANLQTVGPATTITCFLPFSESPDKWGLFEDAREQLVFPKPEPGEAIIGLVREYLRLPKQVRMVWVTK
jgi:hypothetical protein